MAVITIRNFDDSLKKKLRIRAAQNDRSMEDEARDLLRCALSQQPSQHRKLGTLIHEDFAEIGGVELPEISREPAREPVDFS